MPSVSVALSRFLLTGSCPGSYSHDASACLPARAGEPKTHDHPSLNGKNKASRQDATARQHKGKDQGDTEDDMKIPAFWAKERYEGLDPKGQKQSFVACGWSHASLQEAKRDALERARRVFEFMAWGRKPDTYDYPNRPLREEILEEIRDGDRPIALVTRNRYGARVLNAAQVLFADVDFAKPSPNGFFASLSLAFSRKKRETKREAAAQEALHAVEIWAGKNPTRSFRLYRTREGLRLLFTDKLYDPASEETVAILRDLAADPMYMKLTRKQECFRARLTSKPWRCACPRPPAAFPWDDARAESAFRQWESQYSQKDAKYRVCELVKEFGRVADFQAIRTVIDVHDRETRIGTDAPLA